MVYFAISSAEKLLVVLLVRKFAVEPQNTSPEQRHCTKKNESAPGTWGLNFSIFSQHRPSQNHRMHEIIDITSIIRKI